MKGIQYIKSVFVTLLLLSAQLNAQEPVDAAKRDSLIKELKRANVDTVKARVLYSLAGIYEDADPQIAIDFLKQADDIALGTGNLRLQSDITNRIGYNCYYLSDYNNSVKYFLRTLDICEKQNNKQGIAACHNNIGSIYNELDDTTKALKHHLLALKLRKEFSKGDENSRNEIAQSYGNVGKTYFAMGRYHEAMEYYRQSLELSAEIGNKGRQALMTNNIGSIYAEQKKYDEALPYFNDAYKIYRELEAEDNYALCLNNIAEIYYRKKQYDLSAESYRTALVCAQKAMSLPDMKTSYNGLHNCYLQMGDYKQAHDYLSKYIEIKDSIFNEQNSTQINELLAKFDSDRKEQEIKLLQKDKEISSWWRNSLIVGAVLLLFLAFSLYSRYRVKHKANEELSVKNKNIEEQKEIVEHQKLVLEEHQKEILDSITYAKRIQYALLANNELLNENLKNHFVLFNPKDIVSGDFYWAAEHGDYFFLAVCDSTGHGVPGAFMSLLNIGFLSEAIKEKNIEEPGKIFDYVRARLVGSISNGEQKDGMDGILVRFSKKDHSICYASAYNAPVLIRNKQVIELPKDKMPVGRGERQMSFNTYKMDVEKDDMLYLYTDGYADQFGGESGKKFKYRQLNQLLMELSQQPVRQQSEKLLETFLAWKNKLDQVDDVLIVGIKIEFNR